MCARLEALLAVPDDAALAETQEIWSTLPALPAALLEPMQQRFEAIAQALTDNNDAAQPLRIALERNLERKRMACVSMEIIAGVESPPDCAQLRMEYQVARLSASLAGATAKADMAHDPRQLRDQWCLSGALPAEDEAQLDSRFMGALNVWQQREES